MTDQSHTPLPWKVDDYYQEMITAASDGGEIAECVNSAAERAYADAALIVRSVNSLPSLVKALEEAEELLLNLIKSIKKHGNYTPEVTIWFIDQALQCHREALTAYRGEGK